MESNIYVYMYICIASFEHPEDVLWFGHLEYLQTSWRSVRTPRWGHGLLFGCCWWSNTSSGCSNIFRVFKPTNIFWLLEPTNKNIYIWRLTPHARDILNTMCGGLVQGGQFEFYQKCARSLRMERYFEKIVCGCLQVLCAFGYQKGRFHSIFMEQMKQKEYRKRPTWSGKVAQTTLAELDWKSEPKGV